MTQELFEQYAVTKGVPEHTAGALGRYLYQGLPPDGFLMAVLGNDLKGAVSNADEENASALLVIVRFLYNNIPACAWGSEDKVNNWIKERMYEEMAQAE